MLSILTCAVSAFAGEIREFDIPTIEKLGKELARRDKIGAKAEDIVKETQPPSRALKMRGWISELGENADKVYLVAETTSGPCLAYIVTFPKDAKPRVEDRRGQPLPANIAVRYKARNRAIEAAKPKMFPVDAYNFEVLDDPDGNGFLVYGLAFSKKIKYMLTGHLRVTVSSDGEKAEQVDALSNTIVPDPEPPKGMKDAKPVFLSMSQIVSDVPVETAVYINLLHKIPVSIGTMDHESWAIVNGKIFKFTPQLLKQLGIDDSKERTKK
jgi:hypothetical protein